MFASHNSLSALSLDTPILTNLWLSSLTLKSSVRFDPIMWSDMQDPVEELVPHYYFVNKYTGHGKLIRDSLELRAGSIFLCET